MCGHEPLCSHKRAPGLPETHQHVFLAPIKLSTAALVLLANVQVEVTVARAAVATVPGAETDYFFGSSISARAVAKTASS